MTFLCAGGYQQHTDWTNQMHPGETKLSPIKTELSAPLSRLGSAMVLGVVRMRPGARSRTLRADRSPLSDRGAVMAEYGLLLALIALMIISVVLGIGDKLSNIFNDMGQSLETGNVVTGPTPGP